MVQLGLTFLPQALLRPLPAGLEVQFPEVVTPCLMELLYFTNQEDL